MKKLFKDIRLFDSLPDAMGYPTLTDDAERFILKCIIFWIVIFGGLALWLSYN